MKPAICLVPLALALSACGGGSARPEGFSAALPPAPQQMAPARHQDGAIYQASHGYAPLYYGNRAARVGDIVTIVLVERTRTSKSTSGSTNRDGDIGLSLPQFIGIDDSDLNASGGSSFTGSGDASQASSIRADLTVTIAEVRPNGTALVRGEKVMQLSQGEEWVQLSGIIRLADIDQDNRVPSIRVADARISYSGAGSIQRASREGWLSRFFGAISPF
ncbi:MULTISPECIES: flagellar basal body L-ring protein FlgH [unclassified Erythrobacter]|uniref:flagellar basal body L-ring protein FlgH n=1 Tax=Erythrobacteraceae TaxID=335929 RepID=UPI00076C6028|nr:MULTISPECIES: flagellar basal body L-ring protein FlgH [unclassified Erythrobacter]KWV94117.1 flagellar biosynthesis protein FlgH [Erythrobacter sp. AP23]MBO6527408.1 flagellar basal body L-ring protein FlgH [Erythrobacter sp.]MBO6530792.1 flagellar basal body L-ring protein FlgH [Erythrobacter sp.]MBO6769486.1 flagellar basal body L-ring protein FlgH [Erythrobacter sp.]